MCWDVMGGVSKELGRKTTQFRHVLDNEKFKDSDHITIPHA